jgi:activating signal cointegrator 1
MKALTLTQPGATLIACGAKRIETRSWATDFRGRIAIHAAKGLGPVGGKRGLYAQCCEAPFRDVIADAFKSTRGEAFDAARELPLGAIVATADLVDVRRIDVKLRAQVQAQTITPFEIDFGDYTSGRFAWFLENVQPLTGPVPCNGALSLWDVPPEIMAAVTRGQIDFSGFRRRT